MSAGVLEPREAVLPTEEDRNLAKESIKKFSRFGGQLCEAKNVSVRIGPDGEEDDFVPIPVSAFRILTEILTEMARKRRHVHSDSRGAINAKGRRHHQRQPPVSNSFARTGTHQVSQSGFASTNPVQGFDGVQAQGRLGSPRSAEANHGGVGGAWLGVLGSIHEWVS